jgi:MYXO-CTERM domain-containing protein
VESDGERFLGVFLDMAMPTAAPLVQRAETQLELVRVSIPEDTRAFQLATFGQGEIPTVEIAMSADGPAGVEYEYQYRVDRGFWSDWGRSPYAIISELSFVLEGRHSVEARARVVGSTASADLTPARAEFLIDNLSPRVQTVMTDAGTILRADDIVSGPDALMYRHRADVTDAWSDWRAVGTSEQLLSEVRGPHFFEVRDEAGNVGHNAEALRGLPPPSDEAGCGDCAAGGETPSRPLWGLLLLVAMCALLRRRQHEPAN